MHFRRKIGQIRQAIVWSLAKNIGISDESGIEFIGHAYIQKILISRPNHRLGNTLLITPLILDVIKTFPRAEIDLFVKGNAASAVLRNYENINRIIKLPAKPFLHLFAYVSGWIKLKTRRYDLAINAVYHSSSGRLSTRFANATYKCYGDLAKSIREKSDDHQHAAKFPVYALRDYLSRRRIQECKNPIASMDLRLSASEIARGKKLLQALVPEDRKTICLFTYATGMKLYSKGWWHDFFGRLSALYSHFNIIEILPIENTSQLPVAVPAFYSKDIREIGSLIANTDLFIGADSGMMHLASAAQTSTIGLFKVTDPATFGPYNNSSEAIDTSKGSIDDWIKIINKVMLDSGMKHALPRRTGFS